MHYIPYSIFLLLVVLLAPALAFYPKLLRTPLLATAIVPISLLLTGVIAILCIVLHIYTQNIIIFFSFSMLAVAIGRVYKLCKAQMLCWQRGDVYLYMLNFALLMPLIVMGAFSAFTIHDALISWNRWAVEFYQGHIVYGTEYPQLFPLWISYCYKLLGSINLQGVVKALLFVFPFTMMNAIAFSARNTRQHLIIYLLLILFAIFPKLNASAIYNFYSYGYADPSMVACLSVSVALMIAYMKQTDSRELFMLALLAGMAAVFCKQPALLWIGFCLPVMFCWRSYQLKNWDWQLILCLCAALAMVLFWAFGPGPDFYQNSGPAQASLQHHWLFKQGYIASVTYAVYRYFLKDPFALLVLVVGFLACYRNALMWVFTLFVVPAWLLWFMFGAYEIRLGLHVFVVSAVLIAASDYHVVIQGLHKLTIFKKMEQWCSAHSGAVVGSFAVFYGLLFIAATVTYVYRPHMLSSSLPKKAHVYPLNSALTNFNYYFNRGAEYVYHHIYQNPSARVVTPTGDYVVALFPMHSNIYNLRGQTSNLNAKTLLALIQQKKIDYLIDPGQVGSAKAIVNDTLKHCPSCFKRIYLGKTHFHYRLYKVL